MPDLFLSNDLETTVKTEELNQVDNFLSIKAKAKELLPQINWVVTHRKVEYLPQILELRKHSSIQIRRKVATGIAFLAEKSNLEELQKWQLAESDRETWLVLESTIDKIQRKQDGVYLEKSVKILTVTEGLNLVKRLLGEQEYTLEGEITEVRAIRQMYSFAVKDKQDSRLDCWVFSGAVIRSGFPLNEGLAVRITGKFKLSPRNSKVYFEATKIQLSGEGELMRNLKLLEEKLRKEGIFDEKRKRPIPTLPKNILLLASPVSAALTDFIKVLSQRRGGVNIYHLAIKTQGVGAESEILEKLEEVNSLTQKYNIDTVVLTRGGGSQDDLVLFNSEKVVRALHAVNRPTIVAIGHERDTTLAELAADLRASTPSQAAELVSISASEVLNQTESVNIFLQTYFNNRKKEYNLAAERLSLYMSGLVNRDIQNYRHQSQQTGQIITTFIGRTKLETEKLWQNSFVAVKLNLNQKLFDLQNLQNIDQFAFKNISELKLDLSHKTDAIYSNIKQSLSIIRNQFELTSSQIILQDPQNILKMGYAIVRQDSKIVEKTIDLKPGKISIQFQDGVTDTNYITSS
jgi:exodeoxyribonuclease VII large subunit